LTGGLPTQIDIDAQIEWEGSNITAGIERYRASQRESSLGDTDVGTRILHEMLRDLVPGIRQAQDEAADAMRRGGFYTPHHPLLIQLEADKLAVITTRVILSVKPQAGYGSRKVTHVAMEIGSAVRDEIEFENWKTESKAAAKAGDAALDLAALLVARVKGNVDQKTYHRWRKKCQTLRRIPWTREQRLQLGAALLSLAVRFGRGWFVVFDARRMGKTERYLDLSPQAQASIQNLNTLLEVNRPYLMPMICPPKPWTRSSP